MKKKKLELSENLTPVNIGNGCKNSIESFSVAIFFAKETPLPSNSGFDLLHEGQIKIDFPKFEHTSTNSIELSINNVSSNIKTSDPIISGFRMETYKENGNLKQRIAGENAHNYSWLSIDNLLYNKWKDVSNKYLEWINHISKNMKELKVLAVKVQFNDAFTWNSIDKVPYSEIINQDTEYVAHLFMDKTKI